MAKRYSLPALLLFLCLVLCASPAWAQWVKDGTLLCNEPYDQVYPKVVSDGMGAAVFVWWDYRNGNDRDIYINKVGPDGNVYGGMTGVPVCAAPGDQSEFELIPDGTGAAIVVWSDLRSGDGYNDIYAQRIDGDGVPRWTQDGIPICTATDNRFGPRIVPDGVDGAIIAWNDMRSGQYDIYAQRVTGDGDTLWAADGVPIETTAGDQVNVEMVPDGSGGAILMWADSRSGDYDLYAQRVDGDGNLLWGAGGVLLCEESGMPNNIRLVAATDGGAYVAWIDYRNGYPDIYIQKVDEDGLPIWQDGGVAACPETWSKTSPQIVDDGAGGVIVAWYDERNYYEVYAQRMDPDGNTLWSQCGTLVFPSYGDGEIHLIADGAGGVIAALDIYYDDKGSTDIYAQRLDSDGNQLWGPRGAAVCMAPFDQFGPCLVTDGSGGAILAWQDLRAGTGESDLYCQRIGASGLWGKPEPTIVSCIDVPADQGGWVRIKTRASSHDVAGELDTPIVGYNVWRFIGGIGPGAASAGATSARAVSAGAANKPAIDRSKLAALLRDPATATGIRVGGPEAVSLGLPPGDWESVGFWLATRDTLYSAVVPTKNDSTEAGTAEETFIVTAHMPAGGVFVTSDSRAGYSVDNLAPGMTPGFAGEEIASPPGLALSWTRNGASDLWKYDVHRGNDELFVPDVSNRIGTTDGTTLFDPGWIIANRYFYKLVAVDRHGNASPPALLTPENVKVGTMLQSFAASLSGAGVEISWTLSEIDETAVLRVLRSTGGEFTDLASAAIVRSGLSFSVADRGVEPGTTYRYRVNVVEGAASRTLFETDAISTPAMPLTLYQNHPNPFNPSTTIGYYLPVDSPVTLDLYDSSGRLVARLLNGAKQAKGTHSIEWSGLDAQGRPVSSGMYFYRLTSGKETISKKMVLLR